MIYYDSLLIFVAWIWKMCHETVCIREMKPSTLQGSKPTLSDCEKSYVTMKNLDGSFITKNYIRVFPKIWENPKSSHV